MADRLADRIPVSRRAVLVAIFSGGVLSLAHASRSSDEPSTPRTYGAGGYGSGEYGSPEGSTGPNDVTGNGIPATDPDRDGLYEDVNGDGVATVIDVSVLLHLLEEVPPDDERYFDFNADGRLSTVDVSVLLDEI